MRYLSISFALIFALAVNLVAAEPAVAPQLTLVGKGVRQKKVLGFFWASVYEAEFLVNDKPKFITLSAKPLDALAQMDTAEIRLKFLRSVSSTKIKASFEEALEANKVDASTPNMKKFLDQVMQSKSYDEGKSVSIRGDLKNTKMTYVSPEGTVVQMTVAKKDILDIFSIWLGKPADDGLEYLQKALLGVANNSTVDGAINGVNGAINGARHTD